MAWGGARGLIGPDTRFFGRYLDDPQTVAAGQLRSQAGMTIGPEIASGGAMEIVNLPPLRVAVLRFQGSYAELEGAYAALYRDWLPGSGEEPSDQPCLEEYLNDCRTLPPAEWLTDVLLPLRARVPA